MVNEVTKNGMTDCGEILAEAENGKIITDSTEWWMFADPWGSPSFCVNLKFGSKMII